MAMLTRVISFFRSTESLMGPPRNCRGVRHSVGYLTQNCVYAIGARLGVSNLICSTDARATGGFKVAPVSAAATATDTRRIEYNYASLDHAGEATKRDLKLW